MSLFAEVLRALDAGRSAALATVVAAGGSTPRHVGARMVVFADGTAHDTIGGGRIELAVMQAGQAVAAGAPATRVRHHLVRDLAMCCGGWMDIVVAPAAPDRAVLAAAAAAIADRAPVTLTTALADGRLGLAAVEAADGAGPRVVDDVLRERIGGVPRAIVFGAGHVGRALTPLLAGLGFEVIVCDDDDTGALAQPIAGAARTVDSFAAADVAAALGGLGADDHAFVVTRDHAVDEQLMFELMPRPLAYLGMIGSRGKVGRFQKRLAMRGIAPEAWRAVHAPIGLDLGAETPAEIAVAIAAELVVWRRRGRAAAPGWEPRP